MSLAKGEATRLAPPQGWTNDPEHMNHDYYWRGRDGDLKASLVKDYGLPDPRPIITRKPESGDVTFLLQCGHGEDSKTKYYVWNGIENELCLIKSPTNMKEIYEGIQKSGGNLGSVELEVVEAKSDKEPEQ